MEDSMTFHLANPLCHLSLPGPAHREEGLPALKRRCLVFYLLLNAGRPWSKCSYPELTCSEWFFRRTFLEEL